MRKNVTALWKGRSTSEKGRAVRQSLRAWTALLLAAALVAAGCGSAASTTEAVSEGTEAAAETDSSARPGSTASQENSSSAAEESTELAAGAESAEGTEETAVSSEQPSEAASESGAGEEASAEPVVYMTTDISSEGLIAVYEALGASPSGNIAVKLSTGEPGSNYLRTDLIGELVQSFDSPTIVECNTAYGGARANPPCITRWRRIMDIRRLRTWISWMRTAP